MKLIVGLGNPGLLYKETRHNVGYMIIDSYALTKKIEFKLDKNLKGMVARFKYNGEDVILLKPVTFMNLSGESVKAVINYYKININDLLIIHDDMDLPVGKIRIRPSGSSGGQKGMNNIIELLETNEIKRIRIGIDKSEDAINHVLGKFTKEEKDKIDEVLNHTVDIIDDYLDQTFDYFMNKYNRHE